MIPSARQSTAYHEAAHAVAALSFGCRVSTVDIVRTEDRLGVCAYRVPKSPLHQLVILFAGLEAEHQLAWCRGQRHMDGAGSDIRGIARILHDNDLSANDPIVNEARTMVRKLVGENWSAIARLSEWLVAREVASGKLATAIFVSHNVSRREKERVA